jgi:hypothetical protein
MTQGIDGARKLIESRLREIEDEAGSLQRALTSLCPDVGATATPPARPRRRRRKGGRRAPRGQRREQFLAAVKANPGATAAEIGKTVGISTNQAYALGQRLLKDKEIKKSGKGYALKS